MLNNKSEIIGKKLMDYKYKHTGCDNRHVFTFEDGTQLEFFHEDSEGDVRVIPVKNI